MTENSSDTTVVSKDVSEMAATLSLITAVPLKQILRLSAATITNHFREYACARESITAGLKRELASEEATQRIVRGAALQLGR